jgi:MerR family copper efflux transcriptional regulator
MLIGEIAERSGIPTRTIRFYEQARVLTPPARTPAGYRVYSTRALAELLFVKRAQRLGFSLDEIRELLGLGRASRLSCNKVMALCDAHLNEIERQIEELQAFKVLLERARKKARAKCGFTRDGFCKAITGG